MYVLYKKKCKTYLSVTKIRLWAKTKKKKRIEIIDLNFVDEETFKILL